MEPEPAVGKVAERHRVFLVDDHPLVREWLGNLIKRKPDLTLCGQSDSSGSAFAAIAQLRPDVAVIDLSLADGSGLELIKQLHELPDPPHVLVLSMHDETQFAERALRAGAAGYVMKRAATGSIIKAIREVLQGRVYLSEAMASRVAAKFALGRTEPRTDPISSLSDRELEVFQHVGLGLENKRIAEILHLSPKTVQVYCGRIKGKLGLENATALAREAVRWHEQHHGTGG